MSAREVLVAALVERLRALDVAVFDAPPVRAAVPHVVVEEPVLSSRDAVGLSVVEARVAVSVSDAGERPVRLRRLLDAVEAAVAGLPAALGEGWCPSVVTLVRSRTVRAGDTRWRGASEFAVRLYRLAS